MYADDTSLHKAFRTAQDLSDELIPAFVNICEWLKMNKLALNVLKTEFMIIGTSYLTKPLRPYHTLYQWMAARLEG